jgi:hypothetical protein
VLPHAFIELALEQLPGAWAPTEQSFCAVAKCVVFIAADLLFVMAHHAVSSHCAAALHSSSRPHIETKPAVFATHGLAVHHWRPADEATAFGVRP